MSDIDQAKFGKPTRKGYFPGSAGWKEETLYLVAAALHINDTISPMLMWIPMLLNPARLDENCVLYEPWYSMAIPVPATNYYYIEPMVDILDVRRIMEMFKPWVQYPTFDGPIHQGKIKPSSNQSPMKELK